MPKFPVVFNFSAKDTTIHSVGRLQRGVISLDHSFGKLNRKLDVVAGKTKNIDRVFQKTAQTLKGVGRGLTFGVTAPVVGLGFQFVKTAAEAEETASKFEQVFLGIEKSVQDAALAKLTGEFRLASTTAKQLVSDTALVLQGLDITGAQSLQTAAEITALSQDIASFRNVSGGAADVSQRITKALTGERESLKSLGIVITEDIVKKKAAELAARGVRFESVQQAKALAALALIREKTIKDQGDFARTSASLTNQVRILKENFTTLSVTIGNRLQPLAQKLVSTLNSVIDRFLKLSPEAQEFIVIAAGIAAAIGPILLGLGALVSVFPLVLKGFLLVKTAVAVVIPLFTALKAVMSAVSLIATANPFGVMIVGIAALITMVVRLVDKWDELISAFQTGSTLFSGLFQAGKVFLGFGGDDSQSLGSKSNPRGPEVGPSVSTPGGSASGLIQPQALAKSLVQEQVRTNNARADVNVNFVNAPPETRIRSTTQGEGMRFNLGLTGAMQ